MPIPYFKNKGPLLVDKVRGYFDRLPPWLRDMVTFRVEKQKVDAKITDLDATALESELKQEVTDEKLKTSRFLGNGEPGSGNDMSGLPASHPSEVVITGTGQVADVTETVGTTETHLVEGPPLQDGSSEQVGDLWVTKKVEAPTFDKKVFQQSKDDLLPPEFRAAIPEKLEQHVVDGTAALPVLGPIDLARREEQTKVGVKTTTVQSRDTSGTKPVLTGQRIDPDFNGAKMILQKYVAAQNLTIAQPFGLTEAKVTPYDDKNAVVEYWKADGAGFPELVQYNYDNEINVAVVSRVSIVPAGGSYAPGATILDYNERKIDAVHKMRVESFPLAVPPTEVTYETRQFTFPAILTSLEFKLAALATTGRSEVQWTAGVRASFTVPTRFQIYTGYSWTPFEPKPVISWAPGDITFKGISYTMSLSNLLFNSWANIGVTFAGDTLYGNIVDRFSVTATSPSAATYVSWIGTSQCISSTVDRYKRLWRRRDTFVTIL